MVVVNISEKGYVKNIPLKYSRSMKLLIRQIMIPHTNPHQAMAIGVVNSKGKGKVRIISFALTTEALLNGQKTVTRRFWDDTFAIRFKKGDLVKAYSKLPFAGGNPIAIIRLTDDPYKEPLSIMTDAEEKAEGGLWGSAAEFVEMMGGPEKTPWVVRFKLKEILAPNRSHQ